MVVNQYILFMKKGKKKKTKIQVHTHIKSSHINIFTTK